MLLAGCLLWLGAFQQTSTTSYVLIYPDKTLDAKVVDQLQASRNSKDVRDILSKIDYHEVELGKEAVAVLPNHSKIKRYLDIREMIFREMSKEQIGKYDSPQTEVLPLSQRPKDCADYIISSLREQGVVASLVSPTQLYVTLSINLEKDGHLISVPWSRQRTLTPGAKKAVEANTPTYDSRQVSGVGESLQNGVDRRPNVELSINNLRLASWGKIRTNGRVAEFAEQAFKKLTLEYSDLEQRGMEIQRQFLSTLAIQGTDWSNVISAQGKSSTFLNQAIKNELTDNVYNVATVNGLTDMNSVKTYVNGATVRSIRVSLMAACWARFPDQTVAKIGVEI